MLYEKREVFWEVYFKEDKKTTAKEMYYRTERVTWHRLPVLPRFKRDARRSSDAEQSYAVAVTLINRLVMEACNRPSRGPGLTWAFIFWQRCTIIQHDSGRST